MRNFLKGFLYAYQGLIVFFRHERNGRIQLAIAIVVVIISFVLRVSALDWIFVIACITSVLALEMINSSIEKLCNLVHPKYHPAVKVIKDISAGAVLWAAAGSCIVGAIVFLPKLQQLLK